MNKLILTLASAGLLSAASYTGVVTETMCGKKHAMGISPDAKCVQQCVKSDPAKWKYALQVGEKTYVLADQETPAKFAAQKVTVTGTLFEKTGILKADKIEPAK